MNEKSRNQQIVEEMINSISKENTLHQLLKDNKIAEIDKVYEIHLYKIDGGRRGLIVEVQEKNADARSKIMIDLKHGEPIINQVYDALYDIGKECSKRVILYSDGQNDFDKGVPAADFLVVDSLINNLQQYPLGFCLYKIDEDTLNIET